MKDITGTTNKICVGPDDQMLTGSMLTFFFLKFISLSFRERGRRGIETETPMMRENH